MPARVVWAIQAPTLLNILARSDAWQMSVADFGDADGLAESRQLSAPVWDGRREGVRMVFVCSPSHVDHARELLPGVRVALVAHQGYSHKLPTCPEADTVVSFSALVERCIRDDAQRRPALAHLRRFHTIRPWFEVTPTWRWAPNDIWTMRSRPGTREPLASAELDSIRGLVSIHTRVFGQDQPNGMLESAEKQMASPASFAASMVGVAPMASSMERAPSAQTKIPP